jgi:hypothetical protein
MVIRIVYARCVKRNSSLRAMSRSGLDCSGAIFRALKTGTRFLRSRRWKDWRALAKADERPQAGHAHGAKDGPAQIGSCAGEQLIAPARV